MSAMGGKQTSDYPERRMIFDQSAVRRLSEREALKILRRDSLQAKFGIRGKAEASVIGRVSQDDAAGCASSAKRGEASFDQGGSDSVSLMAGRNCDRTKSEPAVAVAVDLYR